MMSPEEQQRDEALTAAGHDPECKAFQDLPCDCQPSNPDFGKATKVLQSYPAVAIVPALGTLTLVGGVAKAYLRYQAAAKALKLADLAHKAAQREYQEAHQAFADATADG
jgi:hypothetical protein